MKILVVTQYFYPETFRVNTLCRELVKRGHEVTVLTGYPQYPIGKIYDGYGFNIPYDKQWNGAKIERLKVYPRGKTPLGMLMNCYSFVREGYKWVKKCSEKFDAVYVFEVSPVTVGLPAVAYKEKFGTPLYFNVQDLWPENVEVVLGVHNKAIIGVINKIVDKIYSASDLILCSSKSFVSNIAARGVAKDKLMFWPQFCEKPDFTGMSKPDVYKNDNFNIVFAGNIGDAQGLDLLVDSASRLKDTNVKWFLVGDGRARENLQRRVDKLGIGDSVVFVGKVSESEANRYIHFADCAYLSFKDNELFNMTIPAKLQSYMACGVPIIAAAGGESAQIVREADCGFVCEQNVDSVVETIKDIIDDKSLDAAGKNSLVYFDNNFNMNVLLDGLEKSMKFVDGVESSMV